MSFVTTAVFGGKWLSNERPTICNDLIHRDFIEFMVRYIGAITENRNMVTDTF